MRRRCFFSLLVAGALVASARAGHAQETINDASVSGRVTDPSGAAVPGATVMARQTATNVAAESVTDASGRVRFPYLRVGAYEVTVALPGFQTAAR